MDSPAGRARVGKFDTPCARMQSAYLIPADAIAEPESPPGFPEDPQPASTGRN